MRQVLAVVSAVLLLALVAGTAIAQNLVIDPGFDGAPTYYSTYNSNTGEWFDVFIMGEQELPWVSCNRFWFTNVTYGWSSVANNRLREGQSFYTPTTLAPGATGSLESIGGLMGQWNGEGSFYQNVYVEPGKTYRFSGYYWAGGEFGDTLSQGQLWVNANGGFSKVINSTWGKFGGANPREQMITDGATQILDVRAAASEWTYFSYDFTAGSDVVGLASRVNVGSSGVTTTNKSWYTDQWSLTEVPEPAGCLSVILGFVGFVGVARRRK